MRDEVDSKEVELDYNLISSETIKNKIYHIRGINVMLDKDLASLYGVETKVLNQAVKRNIDRFPEDLMFVLSDEEFENLRSQIVTSNWGGRRYNPKAFTEQGVYMLATVLKSKMAVDVTLAIMRTFTKMKNFLQHNSRLLQKLEQIEKRQIVYEYNTDKKIEEIFNLLEDNRNKPKQGIFFNGEIFDAYVFINSLIKSAKVSIKLIDNYVDETVLVLFTQNQKVDVTIYTKVSNKLKLDLKKYNSQYKPITIKEFKDSHDRFLIIDDKELYHIGASLKDLGKRWFAFSKMSIENVNILERLK